MGFFCKKEKEYDFSFVDNKISELKRMGVYITREEENILNSADPIEKIKKLFEIEERENFFWKEFKQNYPIGLFAVTPDRKFIEWNRHFEEITGWQSSELEKVGHVSEVLWPPNPKECRVCKTVRKFDTQEKRSGYGWRNLLIKMEKKFLFLCM